MKEDKNLEQNLDKSNEKLHISDVSSSASNGFRPDVYISDDLEELKRRSTPEQIKKMWEDCYPKSSEIIDTLIITGTPK